MQTRRRNSRERCGSSPVTSLSSRDGWCFVVFINMSHKRDKVSLTAKYILAMHNFGVGRPLKLELANKKSTDLWM